LYKKMLFGGTYGITAVLVIVYRDSLVNWMRSDSLGYQDLLVGLIGLLIAVIPAIPYSIVAALFGAKYGALTGSLINLTISCLAAILLFAWIRFTFTDTERAKAANLKGIRRLTVYAEDQAFITILFARLLPFVPAQLVNIYASLTRMKWGPYVLATLLGKTPYLITVTFLGDRAFEQNNLTEILLIAASYLGFILIALIVSRILKKSRGKKRTGEPS